MLGCNLFIMRHSAQVAKDKNLIAWFDPEEEADPEATDDESDDESVAPDSDMDELDEHDA